MRYEDEDDPCDHDDYETDLLDGRCRCDRCGESWYATAAEIDAQLRFETEYHEAMERENRRQWWRDRWDSVKSLFHWRKRPQFVSDDDIPF